MHTGGDTAINHYLKHHRQIGWRWTFYCSAGTCKNFFLFFQIQDSEFAPNHLQGNQIFVDSKCSCVGAKVMYWTNYPDILEIDLDPTYHYQVLIDFKNSYVSELIL